MLYCAVLCCTVLCCALLCCTVLCCAVLYCTVLYCTVLCCAVLTVLCCTVLCYAVLYCTVLCCAVLSDNKVRELITVKVVHTSLLNTTVVAFKVLPLGSYAPMPARSPPFKTILELVLWNGLQSGRCTSADVIKMPSFQYFLYLREQKKVNGG